MGIGTRLRSMFSDTQIVSGGDAAGLKLVARGADPNFARGTYELPVQHAITSHVMPGDVFFDIGANIGFFSILAARCAGTSGQVYAYEPVKRNADAIVRGAALNGLDTIRVFNEAVGAMTGRADLLLTRHIGGAALASADVPPDMTGRLEVDVTTLDDSISRHGLRPPSLVKIDVEGAEIEVLRGMTGVLRAHRPAVLYEVDDATREGLDSKARQIASFMESAGYALTHMPAAYADSDWQVVHIFAQPESP